MFLSKQTKRVDNDDDDDDDDVDDIGVKQNRYSSMQTFRTASFVCAAGDQIKNRTRIYSGGKAGGRADQRVGSNERPRRWMKDG